LSKASSEEVHRKITKTKSRQKEGQKFKINKALKLVSLKMKDKNKKNEEICIVTISFNF